MDRLKYWLFRMLLNEVCEKSVCIECRFFHDMEYPWDDCAIADAYRQARKVWGIDK